MKFNKNLHSYSDLIFKINYTVKYTESNTSDYTQRLLSFIVTYNVRSCSSGIGAVLRHLAPGIRVAYTLFCLNLHFNVRCLTLTIGAMHAV